MRPRQFHRFFIACLIGLSTLLGGCAGIPRPAGTTDKARGYDPASPVSALRAELDEIFQDPSFHNAYWGVAIKSLDNGQVLFTLNDTKGFIPASNMKMYTTAAGLARLGPEFRYETRLLSTDPDLQDGVIDGDLYVLGSGDPSFAGRFHEGDPLAPFAGWIDTLKALGIQEIQGDIVGDDDVFDDEHIPESWYYTYLSEWYAAESGGLCLNDNCCTITLSPGAQIGDLVQIDTVPPAVYGEFIITATTAPEDTRARIRVLRRIDTNLVQIDGRLPQGGREVIEEVSVHNTTLFFVTVLKDALQKAGIPVSGQPRDIDDLDKSRFEPDRMKLLARYQSPPLSEIIRAINKPSQNLYADQLLKTLGARFGEEGSFSEGYQVVKEFLDESGIDSNGFFMIDGSGLGRIDLVQPRQTLGLLETMHRHPNASFYYESLPIAGVDGTIRRRMKGTLAEGNVHAKTGYINRARSLSGYVTTLDGERLAFCMMVNNYTVPTSLANRLQDQVCERLANFTRKRF